MTRAKQVHVTIRTRTVGQHFGTVGQIVSGNGLVLAEGDVRPLGYTSAALADVESIAAERGYQIVEVE